MKKFIEMHDYTKNMKARIAIFSLKGKVDILWEYVKCLRDIRTEKLNWHEFKRSFRKTY